MPKSKKYLIVVSGPTAVGKTKLSIALAKKYDTVVVSADSRQIFKELKIGTACPTEEEMQGVKHYFIASHSMASGYYSASQFEQEALACLDTIFQEKNIAILCGGSGLYIDLLCNGMDDGLPDPDFEIRDFLNELYEKKGIEALREKLKSLDKDFYNEVDLNNSKRLMRAIEVCLVTGKPFSALRKGEKQNRPFQTIKIALNLPREKLYERINLRVNEMMQEGLVEEAKSVYNYRYNNALNTFGYKELFDHFEGKYDLETAISEIKKNTRRYAKRQITWLKRDEEYHWFDPNDWDGITALIKEVVK